MKQQSHGFTSSHAQGVSAACESLDATSSSLTALSDNPFLYEPVPPLPWPSKLYDDVPQ